jgi:hypothetical protein
MLDLRSLRALLPGPGDGVDGHPDEHANPDCGQSDLLAAMPTTVVPRMIWRRCRRDDPVNNRVAGAVVLQRALQHWATEDEDIRIATPSSCCCLTAGP